MEKFCQGSIVVQTKVKGKPKSKSKKKVTKPKKLSEDELLVRRKNIFPSRSNKKTFSVFPFFSLGRKLGEAGKRLGRTNRRQSLGGAGERHQHTGRRPPGSVRCGFREAD